MGGVGGASTLHCMYYVNVLYIYLLVQDGAVCIFPTGAQNTTEISEETPGDMTQLREGRLED